MQYRAAYGHSHQDAQDDFIVRVPSQFVDDVPATIPPSPLAAAEAFAMNQAFTDDCLPAWKGNKRRGSAMVIFQLLSKSVTAPCPPVRDACAGGNLPDIPA
ncbi:hypothetical protein IQ285_32410 [Burkholderia sp. R-69608]|uniref:hypothetical protein n=1 Tax=Paraburkholderia nemoris TaxID=2793076 RepID=UPI001912FFCA|nr:hypothetical protein [Paraburkholderia nemoris]MBK5152403.1 hypothetical protein [Burkholderia sp. R-69608]